MNLWEYLENRNKRKYLYKLLLQAQKDDKTSTFMAKFISPCDKDLLHSWHVKDVEIESRITTIRQKLLDTI